MTPRAHLYGQEAFPPEAFTHSTILQMSEHSGLWTWSGVQGRGPTFYPFGSHGFLAWPRGPEYLLLFLIVILIWGLLTNTGHPSSGSGVCMNFPYNSLAPVSRSTSSPIHPPQNEWTGQGGSQCPLLCCQHGHKPGW